MRVDSIRLDGFRNYEDFETDFSPHVNLIVGENAQGKTNLLEAVATLSGVRSHRAASERELIGFCRQEARIRAEIESRGRAFELDISLRRGGRRRILVNQVKKSSLSELSEYLRCVLFCPEDLQLVRSGAGERRRFLDTVIAQLRPKYAAALRMYKRALEHKTRILKDGAAQPGLYEVLDEFNIALARSGALLIHYRAHFIRKMQALAGEIQRDFSGGRDALRLEYQTVSSICNPEDAPAELYPQLLAHQARLRAAEQQSRQCLSGPHRDELLCYLNETPARQFASQGQTRTIALSLKLAERSLHREDSGQWPVLLLDDVLSELDARRQDFVLERIQGGQLLLSGCEVPGGVGTGAKLLRIENGRLC